MFDWTASALLKNGEQILDDVEVGLPPSQKRVVQRQPAPAVNDAAGPRSRGHKCLNVFDRVAPGAGAVELGRVGGVGRNLSVL